MWKQVVRQFFGNMPIECVADTLPITKTWQNGQRLERANSSFNHREQVNDWVDSSSSLPERPKSHVDFRAVEWFFYLTHSERSVLLNMVFNLSCQGASFMTIVSLIAQRFNVGERLAREVVAWRGREDNLRYGFQLQIPAEDDAKSPSPMITSPRKSTDILEQQKLKLAIWENKALVSKHDYRDEVYEHLLNEEKKQITTWHIVREGAVNLASFTVTWQMCVETVINFSVKYRLQPKTTEASFVLLHRFLLLPEAKNIVKASSGVKGAVGGWSLVTIAMCILMISAKYEQIYPPVLSAFAACAECSAHVFSKLEIRLLRVMNFDLLTATPMDFLGRYFRAVRPTTKTSLLAMFILESSYKTKMTIGKNQDIFNPYMRQWLQAGRSGVMPSSVLMVSRPSEIALGCLILSLAYQGKVCYPVKLEYSSRVRSSVVSGVVQGLHNQLRNETNSPFSRSSAILKKYSIERFDYIGSFKPPQFHELVEHNAFHGTELAKIYGNEINNLVG